MDVRIGAIRGLCLGMVAAGLTALGTVAPPAAVAALPGPDSAGWIAVKKSGATLTDGAGDFSVTHLDLTASGGTLGPATVFVAADVVHASFRFHVGALPADAAGGYVVQFDTDGDTTGWERALRYDPSADTVRFFTAGPNAGIDEPGTAGTTVPMTASTAATYAGADGGGHVAFAVPRAALASAGITIGGPMVIGTTSGAGVALFAGDGLLTPPAADVLGVPQVGAFDPHVWGALVTDPLDFDSDGDGVVDRLDNCPVVNNPGQEDDDAALDNNYPFGTRGAPDGTEGRGNACDSTPRGLDNDGDKTGWMDDQCREQYGLASNGCPAQSTTRAILRYRARKGVFHGKVNADYDQCLPRRLVTVFKVVGGPNKRLGAARTGSTGGYQLKKRATKGTYYALVDPRWTLGARCFGVKSPKLTLR